ncbi:hypothetical protein DL96DRAFT_542754 [Flagelloscypha sp. PMI_526]|nr:hypothetical protein DL96DRAFT_542754 [Flagelloscypha sp. PMI_526]
MASTPPDRDIPAEIIFHVLEYAFIETSPRAQAIPLLLVSKSFYNYIIPKLYHTLRVEPQGTNSYNVKLSKLLDSVNPSSLLHVRRLLSMHWKAESHERSFSPFANLTHLFLMSIQAVLGPDALGIPNLPLEELIISNSVDRKRLLLSLSPDSTLCQTLRKFSSYDLWTEEEDFKGLILCRNLSHILLWSRNQSLFYFPTPPVLSFLRRDGFICWLIIPAPGSNQPQMFDTAQEVFQPLNDRRIVLAKEFIELSRSTFVPTDLWEGQFDLWNAATAAIAQNEDPEVITVVDRMTRR